MPECACVIVGARVATESPALRGGAVKGWRGGEGGGRGIKKRRKTASRPTRLPVSVPTHTRRSARAGVEHSAGQHSTAHAGDDEGGGRAYCLEMAEKKNTNRRKEMTRMACAASTRASRRHSAREGEVGALLSREHHYGRAAALRVSRALCTTRKGVARSTVSGRTGRTPEGVCGHTRRPTSPTTPLCSSRNGSRILQLSLRAHERRSDRRGAAHAGRCQRDLTAHDRKSERGSSLLSVRSRSPNTYTH